MAAGRQRETARGLRIARLAADDVGAPEVAPSAFVLVEICRRALTGAPAQRRRLDGELRALLHPRWAGYLEPQPGEQAAADGARLLVHLVADLARAIDAAGEGEAFKAGTDDAAMARRRRALELYLGRHADPLGADDAMRIAGPQDELDDRSDAAQARRRHALDEAFVEVFQVDTLPPLSARSDAVRDHVATAGFDVLMRWIGKPRAAATARWLEAWNANLSPDGGRMILLLTVLQLAAARFDGVRSATAPPPLTPVGHWYEAHKDAPALRPAVACSTCPATPADAPRCLCRRRAAQLARGRRPGGSTRSREVVARGEAAVELAAWTLLRTHPRDWPSRAQIAWMLQRDATRLRDGRDGTLPVPATLAALGRLLHDPEPPSEVLYDAAEQLDATAGSGLLAVTAQLALAIVDRHAETGSELRPAVAALARSAAGALRELRSPQLPQLIRRLDAGGAIADELKALEAWQDVQLAHQRRNEWHGAALAYELALARVRRLDAGGQKRWEIEEQLHLGRVGGLLLEAEALLYVPGRRLRARVDYARRLLEAAAQLAARDGLLWDALDRIAEIQPTYATGSSPTGAAHPDELRPGVLRFTARWDVMPRIMLARVRVALAASHVPGATAAAHEHLREARELIEATRRSPLLTARQRWELDRVELVAAIVEADRHAIERLSEALRRAGGDDAGDFVAPAAAWRADTLRSGSLRALLGERAEVLPHVAVPLLRLPDLNALATVP